MSDHDRIAELEAEIAALHNALGEREQALKQAQKHGEARVAAANHRARNLLASVRAIASRTAEHARDVDDYIAHFEGRLAALARCQAMLNRSTDAHVDLEELIREELLSHASERSETVNLAGPAVRLDMRRGEAFALAAHELMTNAIIKFGALAHDPGTLDILWTAQDDTLVFDWIERSVAAPQRGEHVGFGRHFIESGLPFQLGAETKLDFNPDGVRFRISMVIGEPSDDAPP